MVKILLYSMVFIRGMYTMHYAYIFYVHPQYYSDIIHLDNLVYLLHYNLLREPHFHYVIYYKKVECTNENYVTLQSIYYVLYGVMSSVLNGYRQHKSIPSVAHKEDMVNCHSEAPRDRRELHYDQHGHQEELLVIYPCIQKWISCDYNVQP